MTASQEARLTDGDLVIALNTPSTFTARVASPSSTGLPQPNLAWMDTVLVPAGEVVNILFDVNRGPALDGSLRHRRAY
jgi:hypothetical protein